MKKLVRLALSCEYSRIPIRRADISTKVLGETGTRQFKVVFERAQHELRTKFGMQMEELPSREKFTISQRRGKLAAMSLVIDLLTFICSCTGVSKSTVHVIQIMDSYIYFTARIQIQP